MPVLWLSLVIIFLLLPTAVGVITQFKCDYNAITFSFFTLFLSPSYPPRWGAYFHSIFILFILWLRLLDQAKIYLCEGYFIRYTLFSLLLISREIKTHVEGFETYHRIKSCGFSLHPS